MNAKDSPEPFRPSSESGLVGVAAVPSGMDSAVDNCVGARNRQIGWVCTALGAFTGLIMGLWSFDGPVSVPEWLGEYGATARRLARLGHIAFFGLGILNLLLARELTLSALGQRAKRIASMSMNFGNMFLPLTLFGAAAYAPLKYLMAVPASAVFLALVLAAYGASRRTP